MLLSDPVTSCFFDVLPVCVEGADEVSERRREEGKPGHVPVLDAGPLNGETVQACEPSAGPPLASEPDLCLWMAHGAVTLQRSLLAHLPEVWAVSIRKNIALSCTFFLLLGFQKYSGSLFPL